MPFSFFPFHQAFLAGEKGCDLVMDAGTFKALRDPTNVIELRGLWEGTVKFRSAGRFICPENDKVNFKGGVDGGVRRSTLAWPHPWTFTTASKLQPGEKLARAIKNTAYVKPIIPGLLLVLIEIDNVWGADWTSGQILPRPECVKQDFFPFVVVTFLLNYL